jgi:hypothetical protein
MIQWNTNLPGADLGTTTEGYAVDSKGSMETYRPDKAASFDQPCRVKITGTHIVVSYEQDGEHCEYKGEMKGRGHFELRADGFQGTATLHCLDNDSVLEGSWVEQNYHGMWRICLHREQ